MIAEIDRLMTQIHRHERTAEAAEGLRREIRLGYKVRSRATVTVKRFAFFTRVRNQERILTGVETQALYEALTEVRTHHEVQARRLRSTIAIATGGGGA